MDINTVTLEYIKKIGKSEEVKKELNLEEGVLEQILKSSDDESDLYLAGVKAILREQLIEKYGVDAELNYLITQMGETDKEGKEVKI